MIPWALQDWDGELPKKQSASATDNSWVRQSDAADDRTVSSFPARGAARGRPMSDGRSYRNGGGGTGRVRPADPRPARSPYDAAGSRQRLSSSEQLPVEVCDVFSVCSYKIKNLTEKQSDDL